MGISWNLREIRGCYRVCVAVTWSIYMAVTVSMWLLRGLYGCYRFYVSFFIVKVALGGSYGT